MKRNNYLEEILVRDLPKKFLRDIPERFHENKVFLVKDNSKTNSSKCLNSILNKRFISKQLNQTMQETTKRELWYNVVQELKDNFDLKGIPTQQYISLSEAVKAFCEKLKNLLGFEYWAFVLDYLGVDTGERALIWNPRDMGTKDESRVMTLKGLDDFEKCPFFLILCEKKATLKPIIEEMINRGFKEGFYGISMKGYATSVVIKLLLRLRKIRKFRLFIAHDLDQNGLMIYFDILRYIDCQNIGITPEFLKRFRIDEKEVSEPFIARNKNAVIKATVAMINKLDIGDSEKERFREWSDYCREKKIELNSISSYNLRRDPLKSKVYDLVDCIETFLDEEGNVWDLNRYKKPEAFELEYLNPEFVRPSIIDDIINEIQEKATEGINNYLNSKNLRNSWEWRDLIKEDYERIYNAYDLIYKFQYQSIRKNRRLFCKENRNYLESLKEVKNVIENQEGELWMLYREKDKKLSRKSRTQSRILKKVIRQTPEYNEIKERLIELRDNIIKILERKW